LTAVYFIKRALFIALLITSFAFGQIRFLPGQLIVGMQNPVQLRKIDGETRTGIAEFDLLLEEFNPLGIEKPFARRLSDYPSRDKILLLKFPQGIDLERVKERFGQLPETAWAIEHFVHSLEFTPNDSLFAEQYYLPQIKASQAWDLAQSAEPVIIGFIDSGVEYTHPDLAPNIWLNPGEDQPPFGILDSADYNGIDDDNNGYIDDLVGWDFVDAPELPYGSDYLEPDNDPTDTFGHGTAVAGIAAAVIDNTIGIAGTAINGVIMPLRCASAAYLTEIAIVNAVIYAVDPYPQDPTLAGASVINMSFGSTDASPLLQDVIQYAAARDVLIAASSGNSGSTLPHYPSGYDQTISVGAVNSYDQVLGLSNRGATLDIVAPGLEIISTVPDAGYDYFWGGTGTSFAAPIVSAGAAMIQGLHPNFSAEDIKSVLLTSADDLYQTGWDSLSGHGRLNIERALLTEEILTAQITSPATGSGFAGDTLLILGTASGLYLEGYTLLWGYGYNPQSWTILTTVRERQIINGLLEKMIFDSTFTDTVFTLSLAVTDIFGFALEDKVTFDYFTGAPQISDVNFYPALDGDQYAMIISFATDQFSTITLLCTGPATYEFHFDYPDTAHLMSLNQDDLQGIYNCQIKARNSAGMQTFSEIFDDSLILDQPPYNAGYYFIKRPNILPPGHLLPQLADFDGDGWLEVFLNQYTASGLYDTLRHFEYNGDTFQPTGSTYGITIPQDLGDSDADGLLEMMSRAYGFTYIFEQTAPGHFPDSLIFIDSTDSYGSKLLDIFPDDWHGEIFLRTDTLYELKFHGYGETSLAETVAPENMGSLGIPHTEWGDFNDDGNINTLFGDGAGHIFVYALQPDFTMEEIFRDSLPFPDTRDFIISGDFDGDSIPEFLAGCHSSTEIVEFGYDLAYWQFFIYDYDGDDGFYRTDSFYFVGASDPAVFDAGMSSGDTDNDGKEEILLAIHPNLYLLEFDDSQYQVTWNYPNCTSNQVMIHDLDNNGLPELIFNRGDAFASFEAPGGANLPPPPMNLTVYPQDQTTLRLNWNSVPDINFYQISRGTHPDSLTDVHPAIPPDTFWINTGLTTDQTYYYAVSTYKEGFYSPFSQIVSGIPNTAPELVYKSFIIEDPHFLRLGFSETMSDDASIPTNYTISGAVGSPSTAILEGGRTSALLTFDNPFIPGLTYYLNIGEIHDQQGTTIASFGPFSLTAPNYLQQAPYLVQAFTQSGQLMLEFSQAMNPDTAAQLDRYSITFGETGVIDITAVLPNSLDYNYVILYISPHTPIAALGHIYTVSVSDLYSVDGMPIDPEHSSVTISRVSSDLDNVFAYPNPYRAGDLVDGEQCVVIANLTPNATVSVFNLSGELVKKLQSLNTYGGVKWYLDNQNGEPVASGVYIYYVQTAGHDFIGKIAVMR